MKTKLNLQDARAIGNIEILARQLVEGFITGLHKSPYHGFSVEFAEHRLYNPGETTRHIDWKVYARTDKLFTKRYEEETNLRCQIILDNSSSMHYPVDGKGKVSFSIMAAAAIAHLLNKQRDAVGLCTFSDDIDTFTPVKSTGTHIHRIFHELQNLLDQSSQSKKTDIANVLNQIVSKIHKRSLVVIFSDMLDHTDDFEHIMNALQHLKHNQHEVLLFHVTDRLTEMDFGFDEQPTEFVDLESGDVVKLQPTQLKKSFENNMRAWHHELKVRCGQAKIDYIEADINEPFDKVLLAYLKKRQKMK